jgi:hypothetical protein
VSGVDYKDNKFLAVCLESPIAGVPRPSSSPSR